MKRFQEIPAFWRYFGARFKPFTRPMFLGSVGFLTLSGVAFYQYWHRPDWLHNSIEKPLEAVFSSRNSQEIPQIPEEDLAKVADIDNIDLLLEEIGENQAATPYIAYPEPNRRRRRRKNSPDAALTRFQENESTKTSISNYGDINTNNNALDNLLKPPTFTNYNSPISKQANENLISNGSNSQVIPNPVGRLYKSNGQSSLSNNIPRSNYSPNSQTNPLLKLGDRSGNINLRQQVGNRVGTSNTFDAAGNATNETRVENPNTPLNQPTNTNNSGSIPTASTSQFQPSASGINNVPSSFSPYNTSGNINRVNPQINSSNLNSNNVQLTNPNIYSRPTFNYNQSVPGSYQLQPGNFGQQNPRNSNQLNPLNSNPLGDSVQTTNQFNRNNTLSSPLQNQQLNNNLLPSSTQTREFNNQPITNRAFTPTLQPASPLYSTPIGR